MANQSERSKSTFKNIFIHPRESRLRLLWRLLVFGVLLALTTVCATLVVSPALLLIDPSLNVNNRWVALISSLASLVSITTSVFLVRYFIDRKSIKSLGLRLDRRMFPDMLVGFWICFFQFLLIYGISIVMGWTEFTGFAWQVEPVGFVIVFVLVGLLMFMIVGWTEELVARGYLLQNLEEGTNLFWAIVISSSLFSVAHFFNPNRTWPALLGLLLAGLFLAYAYLRTRQLWLAIGLHIGWNFFEGNIFGYPVSGLSSFGLIQHETTGPEMWTGGQFGPEAGLIVIPGLLLGTFLVWLYTCGRDTSQTPKTTPLLHKDKLQE